MAAPNITSQTEYDFLDTCREGNIEKIERYVADGFRPVNKYRIYDQLSQFPFQVVAHLLDKGFITHTFSLMPDSELKNCYRYSTLCRSGSLLLLTLSKLISYLGLYRYSASPTEPWNRFYPNSDGYELRQTAENEFQVLWTLLTYFEKHDPELVARFDPVARYVYTRDDDEATSFMGLLPDTSDSYTLIHSCLGNYSSVDIQKKIYDKLVEIGANPLTPVRNYDGTVESTLYRARFNIPIMKDIASQMLPSEISSAINQTDRDGLTMLLSRLKHIKYHDDDWLPYYLSRDLTLCHQYLHFIGFHSEQSDRDGRNVLDYVKEVVDWQKTLKTPLSTELLIQNSAFYREFTTRFPHVKPSTDV